VVLCAAVLFSASPSVRGGLLLAAAVVVGGTPVLAGILVSRGLADSLLGPLLVLPGFVAALGVLGLFPSVARWTPPGADYVTAASQGDWVLVYVMVALPLLLFPEGRATTRLGRWLLALIIADAALFLVVAATAPGPFLPPDQNSPHVLGTMPATLSGILTAISLPGLPLTLIGLAVHLFRSYRVADDRRRRQFRWLALAAALLPLTLLSTWLGHVHPGSTYWYLSASPELMAVAGQRLDTYLAGRP